MNFDEALRLFRTGSTSSVLLALAEEVEQLRQEVAALKAWRDSATGCAGQPLYMSRVDSGAFDYDTKVINLSAEEMRLIEESPDCGEWTKDGDTGEQIQVEPSKLAYVRKYVDEWVAAKQNDSFHVAYCNYNPDKPDAIVVSITVGDCFFVTNVHEDDCGMAVHKALSNSFGRWLWGPGVTPVALSVETMCERYVETLPSEAAQPDDPSEGDRLMAFFKGE